MPLKDLEQIQNTFISRIRHDRRWQYDRTLKDQLWTKFHHAYNWSKQGIIERVRYWSIQLGQILVIMGLLTVFTLNVAIWQHSGFLSSILIYLCDLAISGYLITALILSIVARKHFFRDKWKLQKYYAPSHYFKPMVSNSAYTDNAGILDRMDKFMLLMPLFVLTIALSRVGNPINAIPVGVILGYLILSFREKPFCPFTNSIFIPHITAIRNEFLNVDIQEKPELTEQDLIDPISLEHYSEQEIANINRLSTNDFVLLNQTVTPLVSDAKRLEGSLSRKDSGAIDLILRYVKTHPVSFPDLLPTLQEISRLFKILSVHEEILSDNKDIGNATVSNQLTELSLKEKVQLAESRALIKKAVTVIQRDQLTKLTDLLNTNALAQRSLKARLTAKEA